MKKCFVLLPLWTLIVAGASAYAGLRLPDFVNKTLLSPFVKTEVKEDLFLRKYSFSELRKTSLTASQIEIGKQLQESNLFYSFQFSFYPLGKKMTGQLNLPLSITEKTKVIVLLRGYVAKEIYETGVGTKNAAAVFAEKGYITISPDFFGYGESDPEPENSWQARFEKPLIVLELIKSIRDLGIPTDDEGSAHATEHIGMWAHSNGGQIALSALAISQQPIPTTLWAPVTAPFPYSILFFSDEDADEGKGMRLWINQLERKYNLKEFSFTNYLDGIQGPLQLQHGTADEAALKTWSDEFLVKIKAENAKRETPLPVTYFTYQGADHNLAPKQHWNLAIQRDLSFFEKYIP
ncbi:hypothetical protein KA078_01790 [Candidatus Woesebacteria bacterium]|nr:hypothetical protein [Candidatus Woesebacteria bacterium]